MNESWAVALTVFVLGQALACAGFGLRLYLSLTAKLAEFRENCEHRFTVLEVSMERQFLLTGTNTLHSPDDHLGTDQELERFALIYKAHNYDLPAKDWAHYHEVFKKVAESERSTPNEKALAEGLAELCEHKMSRYGISHTRRLLENQ